MEKKVYQAEFARDGAITITGNQSVLEASLVAGIPLFHVCGGQARCSTCRILVLEGIDLLTVPTEQEKILMNYMRFPPNVRLACQSSVTGNGVKLARIVRDETDIGLYTGMGGTSTRHIATEKEVVLFFLDIRNFTVFVETHLPFDVIHIIRKLFTAVEAVIAKNNGRVMAYMPYSGWNRM